MPATDFDRCVREGTHFLSQRHSWRECPVTEPEEAPVKLFARVHNPAVWDVDPILPVQVYDGVPSISREGVVVVTPTSAGELYPWYAVELVADPASVDDAPIVNVYELYDANGVWLGRTSATSCEEATENWLRLYGEHADRAVL